MGMYANINGQEVKFSGRLARAINNIGIDTTDNVVVVPASKVVDLISEIAHLLDETKLSKGFSLQDLYGYANDAHKLSLLATHHSLNNTSEEIVFA